MEDEMERTVVRIPLRLQKGRKIGSHSWSYLEAYVIGKWRPVRGYITRNPEKLPSRKILDAVRNTLMVNTGWKREIDNKQMAPVSIEFDYQSPVIEVVPKYELPRR